MKGFVKTFLYAQIYAEKYLICNDFPHFYNRMSIQAIANVTVVRKILQIVYGVSIMLSLIYGIFFFTDFFVFNPWIGFNAFLILILFFFIN